MLNFKTNHKQAALKELICHADAILIGAGAGLPGSMLQKDRAGY